MSLFFKKEKSDDAQSAFKMPIDKPQIRAAMETLYRYKDSKYNLEKRIVENEQWWKMRHWQFIRENDKNNIEPASGWLFNSIANKHADAMDNYPEPNVLPRESGDTKNAKALSSILPVILERNDFEKIWSDVWWYKLKTGTGCYGVFWNSTLNSGEGDVDIRQMDILNIFWESGIKDIQNSRNLFTVELTDNELLEEQYPLLKGKLGGYSVNVAKYLYDDTVDTTNKTPVVDWYYKKTTNGRTVVHYCKFVNDVVLYASENEEYYKDRGYYDHGMYPFVFDSLFTEEGTPCGFGFIDVMKDTQMYIDKLNQIIIKNAMQSGKRRFFISDNTGINEDEFADWSREFVHVAGNMDERTIKEISVSQLDSSVMNVLQLKINELKEISGNRDFMQGGTNSGVTAASAIAALQESGSKLSRDMIKGSYRAFKAINYMIIELIRQFYTQSRHFRITGDGGGADFVEFSNTGIKKDDAFKKPVFDIEVTVQRSSPFTKTAQNELAKQMYASGMFNPDNSEQALICLEMMDFDGKNTIINRVAENAKMYNHIKNANAEIEKLRGLVDKAYTKDGKLKAQEESYIKSAEKIIKNASKAQTQGGEILSSAKQKAKAGNS